MNQWPAFQLVQLPVLPSGRDSSSSAPQSSKEHRPMFRQQSKLYCLETSEKGWETTGEGISEERVLATFALAYVPLLLLLLAWRCRCCLSSKSECSGARNSNLAPSVSEERPEPTPKKREENY